MELEDHKLILEKLEEYQGMINDLVKRYYFFIMLRKAKIINQDNEEEFLIEQIKKLFPGAF